MKKLFLLLLISGFLNSNAQHLLEMGNPDAVPRVVKPPFFYRDALKNSAGAWRQDYLNAGVWEQNERIVVRKNSDGAYTELTRMQWNNPQQNWMVKEQYLYTYTKNSQQQVEEIIADLAGASIVDWKMVFAYSGGKVSEMDYFVKFSTNYSFAEKTFYYYDGNGRRIKDSAAAPTYPWVHHYTYDANGRCINWLQIQHAMAADTIYNDSFFYNSAGQLEKISGKGGVTSFTYDANGQVDEANVFVRLIGKDSLVPTRHYKHSYTSNGKIVTMVNRVYAENFERWLTEDSLVNSFTPSGNYDTGYLFTANNNWEPTFDRRLVYGLASMGIAPAKTSLPCKVYPNPAQSYVTIELPEGISSGEITITDITGKTVRQYPISAVITEIPLDIQPGVYFLHAGGYAAKFIKQ
ncbi:MAG TPA: T9SS type A sorting domain-containing protein [Bacteroidia bacterium]|nr:T9SS type A sorting domain-containing protein [Bacteroidia bacterium]